MKTVGFEVYEKVACWCEMNDKEKSVTIEEAEVSPLLSY